MVIMHSAYAMGCSMLDPSANLRPVLFKFDISRTNVILALFSFSLSNASKHNPLWLDTFIQSN